MQGPQDARPQTGPRPMRAHTPEMGTSLLSGVSVFPPSDRQRVMTERADNSSSCPENRKVSTRKATVQEARRQEREPMGCSTTAPHRPPAYGRQGRRLGLPVKHPKARLRERLPTPVFWPGEFHRLCSPWALKESDTTERLSLHYAHMSAQHLTKSMS